MFTAAQLTARRDALARAAGGHRGPVLVPSGLPLPIAGTDQYHDYHAHNEHYYLAGTAIPGSVLAFDARSGWELFVPVATREERVWVGDGVSLDEARAASHLESVRPLGDLGPWLESRRGEPIALLGNDDLAHQPSGYGLGAWAALEAAIDEEASARLSEAVAVQRRTKDPGEIALMRAAANTARAGHLAAMRLAHAGMTERRLQVELEAEFFRAGAERTAYGSIVGSGPNGAVLHFAPTHRELREGDLVLIDASGEYRGYAADVTRTFPVSGRYEGAQRDLYSLVLAVQEQAIARARPGVEYRDLHLEAALGIASGLVDLGILRGDPASLVEQDAHAIFFPHGLGHMLGLATHDAGGCLAGRTRSDRFGLKWLRADLPLQPGYVVTIEPGIYVIPAILDDPARRERYHDAVDWERVDALRGFGGIRIEDDILVTEGAPEVLTAALPSDIASIEALRSEAFAR